MKFTVTMKDPDCLSNALREAVKEEVGKVTGLFEREHAILIEDRTEEVYGVCSRWFRYGEYLTVEIDTEEKTCVVVPR